MAKRKNARRFTDLNFTKQELAKNSHAVVAKVGYHILLRIKRRTAVNSVYALKVLAKGQKIKSIKNVIGFKTKTMLKTVKRKVKSVGKTVRRRAKTARSYPLGLGGERYSNGRTFKSRRKPQRLIKGTPEAKRHMAMLRSKRR